MVVPCELWQISLDCELSNWMTMILELTIAGIFAIVISIIFHKKQKEIAEKLFEFEYRPKFRVRNLVICYTSHGKEGMKLDSVYDLKTPNEPFSAYFSVINEGEFVATLDSFSVSDELDDSTKRVMCKKKQICKKIAPGDEEKFSIDFFPTKSFTNVKDTITQIRVDIKYYGKIKTHIYRSSVRTWFAEIDRPGQTEFIHVDY